MVVGEHWRPFTEEEKRQMKDIGFSKYFNVRREAFKKAKQRQIELSRLGRPFDFKAYKRDFEAAQKDKFLRGFSRKFSNEEEVPHEQDFDKYEDLKNFVKGDTKRIQKTIGRGVTQTVYDVTYQKYTSTLTGVNFLIEVPSESSRVDAKEAKPEAGTDKKSK